MRKVRPMAIITIRRSRSDGDILYEIDDYKSYVASLHEAGIEAPKAKYVISIPTVVAAEMSTGEIAEQVALFFRLGPGSGIEYAIVEQR
jgi:hypothetical protein